MQTLRKIITKYIYRIVGGAVFVTLIMVFVFQLMHEQNSAYRNAKRTFLQMAHILEENEEELVKIRTEYAQSCLHAAEAVARIIKGDPEALHSLDKLKKIAAEVEVDEIHIFDREGKIFSGTLPQYYGYTVDSGEQMSFFKPMLVDKSLKLVQIITENTAERKLMQYSAVWNSSEDFIVQVGMNPASVIKVTKKNELSYIFSLFRVNPNASYYAIDEKSGIIIGSHNLEAVGNECSDIGLHFDDIKNAQGWFYSKVNGQYSFCVFQKIDSNYIGYIVPVEYIHQNMLVMMLLIFLCLIIVSFVMVKSFERCMNKNVVGKIHNIIQKLKLITEGKLEERINVQSSFEFQELSKYINQMVQSLLKNNEIEQQINKTLRLALQASDPEKSLKVMLECLGKSLSGKRAYIFEKNKLGGDDNTYEWVADGVTPEIDHLQNLPPEVCQGWYRKFSENMYVLFENIEDMREEDPLQYENLKSQGIVSIAIAPLHDGDTVIGFYGVDDPPVEMLLHTANLLCIMGHFIESLLRVRNLVRNLKQMSHLDQLTQIGNRHALWEYVDKLERDASIGIIYCDITGLKRVNDTEGHEAGDRLILSACECMKKALSGYALFRLGGDELLAICSGISEADLWERVGKLKDSMGEYGVVLAIGVAWRDDSAEEVTTMMAEAETLMYKDKAAYYAASKIERRR